MTPLLKAIDLVTEYMLLVNGGGDYEYRKSIAKQCALIAVDEIIDVICDIHIAADSEIIKLSIIYFEQVKSEIQSL